MTTLRIWDNVQRWDQRRKTSKNEDKRLVPAQKSWEHIMRDMGMTWLRDYPIGKATHEKMEWGDGYDLYSKMYGYAIRVTDEGKMFFALFRPKVQRDPENSVWQLPHEWVLLGPLSNDALSKATEVVKARQQPLNYAGLRVNSVLYEYSEDRRYRRKWDATTERWVYQYREDPVHDVWTTTLAVEGHKFSALFNPALTPEERARLKHAEFAKMYGARTDHVHWAHGSGVAVDSPFNNAELRVAKWLHGQAEIGNVGNEATDDDQGVKMFDPSTDLEALERADAERSARLHAEIALVRKFDAREPQGVEPTISWSYHTSNAMTGDPKVYTYWAGRCNDEGGDNLWYVTGPRAPKHGMTWRELGALNISGALRGDPMPNNPEVNQTFYLVTEWSEVQ